MPIYEYVCKDCDNIDSRLIRSNENKPKFIICRNVIEIYEGDNLMTLDQCKKRMTPVVSRVSSKFIGDGFYINDYKDKP